jgi:hypothetical protein
LEAPFVRAPPQDFRDGIASFGICNSHRLAMPTALKPYVDHESFQHLSEVFTLA